MKFVIPGKPVIQERPRLGRYGNFYDPSSKERKKLSAELLVARQKSRVFEPFACDLAIRVDFHVYQPGKKRIDLSNMLKALEDSGNGILWDDDSRIRHIDIWKHGVDEVNQRTEVEITALDGV